MYGKSIATLYTVYTCIENLLQHYNNNNNNNGGFYIALLSKALYTLLPQQACFGSTYILFLNLHSGVYSPNSCGLYALRVLSSTIQAHHIPSMHEKPIATPYT